MPSGLTHSYQDSAASTLTATQGFGVTGSWKCPVGVTAVKVECYGGGGGGGGSSPTVGGGGGGGGGYSRLNALSVTPGTIYTVTVGTGGAGGAANGNGTAGGDSWFSTSGTVLAKGGGLGPANAGTGGAGGVAASGVGDVTFSGGAGGDTAVATGGAGGGSAAGSIGNGNVGQVAQPGGGAFGVHVSMGGAGGGGGAGGTSSAGDGGAADRYGGGGGAAGAGASNNAIGGGGLAGAVYLTWTTSTVGLPTTSANLQNPYNVWMYSDVAADDGDYVIQFGSEYVISEFKYRNPRGNNTDNIAITWKGRSTESTVTSSILLQIYNQNSSAWETIASENRQPADVDFVLSGKQTANLSNYYDASNIVSARVYQLVV